MLASPHPCQANTVVHAIQSFKAPANVLVWGAGFDSELWCQVNAGGRTVFLEQNPDFAQHIQALVPDCPIVLVNYTTLLPQAADLMGAWRAGDGRGVEVDGADALVVCACGGGGGQTSTRSCSYRACRGTSWRPSGTSSWSTGPPDTTTNSKPHHS